MPGGLALKHKPTTFMTWQSVQVLSRQSQPKLMLACMEAQLPTIFTLGALTLPSRVQLSWSQEAPVLQRPPMFEAESATVRQSGPCARLTYGVC